MGGEPTMISYTRLNWIISRSILRGNAINCTNQIIHAKRKFRKKSALLMREIIINQNLLHLACEALRRPSHSTLPETLHHCLHRSLLNNLGDKNTASIEEAKNAVADCFDQQDQKFYGSCNHQTDGNAFCFHHAENIYANKIMILF